MKFLLLLINLIWVLQLQASVSSDLTSEVIAQSHSERQWDWRAESFSLEFGKVSISERNDFSSAGYELAARTILDHFYLGILGLRKIEQSETSSSQLLSMTPFNQAAQASRHELFLQGGIPLLAGRSFTILSPWLPDWEHTLYFKLGAHYNFYNNEFNLKSEPKVTLPAQRLVNYKLVYEYGCRLQFSMPRSLSLYFDFDKFGPMGSADPDLPDWSSFSGGISWSFY